MDNTFLELQNERSGLMQFIRWLNGRLLERRIFIEPYMCTEVQNETRSENIQRDITGYINDCDMVLFMCENNPGKDPVKDMPLAYNASRTLVEKHPQVFTFLKINEKREVSQSTSIHEVIQIVEVANNNMCRLFSHTDSLIFEILLVISDILGVGSEISIRRGNVYMGDLCIPSEFLQIDRIFAFENCTTWQELKNEIPKQRKALSAAIEENNNEAIVEISKELETLTGNKEDLEQGLLAVLKDIHAMNRTKMPPSQLRRRALSFLECGEYFRALSILNTGHLELYIKNIEKLSPETDSRNIHREQLLLVQEARVVIHTLSLVISDVTRFIKMEQAYDFVLKHIPFQDLEMLSSLDFVQEYIQFLYDNQRYEKAESVTQELIEYYFSPKARLSQEERFRFFLLAGKLFRTVNKPEQAESSEQEALQYALDLMDHSNVFYDTFAAKTYEELATTYEQTGQFSEAEEAYTKALPIYNKINQLNRVSCIEERANAYYRLAQVLLKQDKNYKAIPFLRKSLALYEQLTAENDGAFDGPIAYIYRSWAEVDWAEDRKSNALDLYQKALHFFERLSKENPTKYDYDYAETAYQLAGKYSAPSDEDRVGSLLLLAANLYGRHKDSFPACGRGMLIAKHHLAILYCQTGQISLAEPLLQEIEKLLRSDETIPSYFSMEELGYFYEELGCNFEKCNKPIEAEKHYKKAIETFKKAEKEDEAYQQKPKIAFCYYLLCGFLTKQGKSDEAKKAKQQALKLAKNYPEHPVMHLVLMALNSHGQEENDS